MAKKNTGRNLVVVNKNGFPTGKTLSEKEVRKLGKRHAVVYTIPIIYSECADSSSITVLENKRGGDLELLPDKWVPFIGGRVEERDREEAQGYDMYRRAAAREWAEETRPIRKITSEHFSHLTDEKGKVLGREIDLTDFCGYNNLQYIVQCGIIVPDIIQDLLNPNPKAIQKLRKSNLDSVMERAKKTFSFLPEDFIEESYNAAKRFYENYLQSKQTKIMAA